MGGTHRMNGCASRGLVFALGICTLLWEDPKNFFFYTSYHSYAIEHECTLLQRCERFVFLGLVPWRIHIAVRLSPSDTNAWLPCSKMWGILSFAVVSFSGSDRDRHPIAWTHMCELSRNSLWAYCSRPPRSRRGVLAAPQHGMCLELGVMLLYKLWGPRPKEETSELASASFGHDTNLFFRYDFSITPFLAVLCWLRHVDITPDCKCLASSYITTSDKRPSPRLCFHDMPTTPMEVIGHLVARANMRKQAFEPRREMHMTHKRYLQTSSRCDPEMPHNLLSRLGWCARAVAGLPKISQTQNLDTCPCRVQRDRGLPSSSRRSVDRRQHPSFWVCREAPRIAPKLVYTSDL